MFFRDLEGQLTRWMERLQQYDFEIIYHKGVLYKNANGLSRLVQMRNVNVLCKDGSKGNFKNGESAIAWIVLSEENLETWCQEQLDDFGILPPPLFSLFLPPLQQVA